MSKNRGLIATLFAWNDLLLSLFAASIFLFAVFITQIQKTKTADAKIDNAMTGNVSVYCFWPDDLDVDVDLHLVGPDGEHISYQRMQGRFWSILRDDLGAINDPSPRNFENAATRGLEAGHYIINLHAYRVKLEQLPVVVDCEVRITSASLSKSAQPDIYRNQLILTEKGEEQTVLRFDIDSAGALVRKSVSKLYETIIRN